MAAKAQQEPALTDLLADRWEQGAKKMEDLAKALPEGKLEWHPAEGARSYGDVLRHVAFWNQYAADCLNGTPGDDSANELPRREYETKAKIVEALARSSRDVA